MPYLPNTGISSGCQYCCICTATATTTPPSGVTSLAPGACDTHSLAFLTNNGVSFYFNFMLPSNLKFLTMESCGLDIF